jgi:NAD+ diphosphatase
MKLAETVTFGGSGLDRAAQIRGTHAGLPESGDSAIVLWRGRVLIEKMQEARLLRTSVLNDALSGGRWIFLGYDEGPKVFACDISHWMPEDNRVPDPNVFFDSTERHHPAFGEDALFCELRGHMGTLTARDAELAATAKALFHWHNSHQFCSKCGEKSKVKMSGWQRSCENCKTSHFPRTDPVVIMLITNGNSVLLGRSPNWPEGMYSLLAGFLEPGETIEAAVRREVLEESGIAVGGVSYLASQPWSFPNSLMIGCHGHAMDTKIKIDPNELEDAFWISKSDLVAAFADKDAKVRPARFGSIAQFLLKQWLSDSLD